MDKIVSIMLSENSGSVPPEFLDGNRREVKKMPENQQELWGVAIILLLVLGIILLCMLPSQVWLRKELNKLKKENSSDNADFFGEEVFNGEKVQIFIVGGVFYRINLKARTIDRLSG